MGLLATIGGAAISLVKKGIENKKEYGSVFGQKGANVKSALGKSVNSLNAQSPLTNTGFVYQPQQSQKETTNEMNKTIKIGSMEINIYLLAAIAGLVGWYLLKGKKRKY